MERSGYISRIYCAAIYVIDESYEYAGRIYSEARFRFC